MNSKELDTTRSFATSTDPVAIGWAGGHLIPKTVIQDMLKNWRNPNPIAAYNRSKDWVYGTVIERRTGSVWSRAMYVGKADSGRHEGVLLDTSFGPGMGVDSGDVVNIDIEDWEKVNE